MVNVVMMRLMVMMVVVVMTTITTTMVTEIKFRENVCDNKHVRKASVVFN